MLACFACFQPVTGSLYQNNGLHYCHNCFASQFPELYLERVVGLGPRGFDGPPGSDGARGSTVQECEECGHRYSTTKNWSNTRICSTCEDDLRYELQQPAHDADLTPDERRYLQRSLGTDFDPQDDLDAPFCQSCIKHGDDRRKYPCLRESDCGWERKKKVAQDPGQLVGMPVQITINTNTSNATTSLNNLQRTIINDMYIMKTRQR